MQKRRTGAIRVLVVDDHPLFRLGLTQLFALAGGIEVCGEAGDAVGALALVKQVAPTALVVDLSLKGQSGLHLIKEVRALSDDLPVLVLSVHDETLFGERALRAGANGYLMKDEPAERIVDALRRISHGEIVVSRGLSDRMLRRVSRAPDLATLSPVHALSDRELEIFELLGHGQTTRQIASTLHISGKTVETHRLRIKEKLQLDSANALMRAAMNWVGERGSSER